MTPLNKDKQQTIEEIIASARERGIEINEKEAQDWLLAIEVASKKGSDIVFDFQSGVFGQNIAMLDFSPDRLIYFREVGDLVEFKDLEGTVETALALSGSSAQSKIQSFPGDADFFERINIKATSREKASAILAKIMRQKAIEKLKGSNYQLIEVKFGNFPFDITVRDRSFRKGTPIAWEPSDIQLGKIQGFSNDGKPLEIFWDEVASDPGWCKLDWIVADPIEGKLANASNMLDVTWEAPDGSITPLDGYLDPYYQEVYLQAESVPLFSKLAKHVNSDALDDYVKALEGEVKKYITKNVNYGKAAKRMYNIFRLTGRYKEAAYLRELFDEPSTLLYQVWSLIRTVDDVVRVDSEFKLQQVLNQIDQLILQVVDVMEDARETEIVKRLLNFRNAISSQATKGQMSTEAEVARAEVLQIVNNFFYEKLTALPGIKGYLENISKSE